MAVAGGPDREADRDSGWARSRSWLELAFRPSFAIPGMGSVLPPASGELCRPEVWRFRPARHPRRDHSPAGYPMSVTRNSSKKSSMSWSFWIVLSLPYT